MARVGRTRERVRGRGVWMILTDREIRLSIEQGLISVEPTPPTSAYSSTSLDLTLDTSVRIFKQPEPGLPLHIDPSTPGYNFNRAIAGITSSIQIGEQGEFVLEPGKLILAWTREQVHLRSSARIAARVEGKSSLARLGLAVHVTAPTIHAGFQGTIQLEIINHGPALIHLRAGMRICQLIFEQTVGFPEVGYGGQFNQQRKT